MPPEAGLGLCRGEPAGRAALAGDPTRKACAIDTQMDHESNANSKCRREKRNATSDSIHHGISTAPSPWAGILSPPSLLVALTSVVGAAQEPYLLPSVTECGVWQGQLLNKQLLNE